MSDMTLATRLQIRGTEHPADLRHLLMAEMIQPGDISIDASDVERLPSSLVQIITAAARDLHIEGRRCIILNPSIAFTLAFETLGLDCASGFFTTEYL
jgi:anti-anti-sigma regulatory factor